MSGNFLRKSVAAGFSLPPYLATRTDQSLFYKATSTKTVRETIRNCTMNQKSVTVFLLIFLGVSLLNLMGQFQESNLLANLSKPILMPSLALYFATAAKSVPSSFLRWVLLALFFCWLGDVFLMGVVFSELFFIVGLLSFLVGHLLYVVVYQMATHATSQKNNFYQRVGLVLPFLAFSLVFFVYLMPYLGQMLLPVLVYTLVITLMGIAACFRYGATTQASFVWVLAGASAFILSDSLIAVNKFIAPFAWAGFWIMLTYLIGQFFIVKGLLLHFK